MHLRPRWTASRLRDLAVLGMLCSVGGLASAATTSGCHARTSEEASVCASFELLRTAHSPADSPPLSAGTRQYLRSKHVVGLRFARRSGSLGWYIGHGPRKSC